MGHTHYFPQRRDFTPAEFEQLCNAVREIIARSNVRIVREYDQPNDAAWIGLDLIAFNGSGEDGHETFCLEPTGHGFQFCKTAQKPYDVVVTASLIAAETLAPGALEIDSDGGKADWLAGVSLANEVLPIVVIPPRVAEKA